MLEVNGSTYLLSFDLSHLNFFVCLYSDNKESWIYNFLCKVCESSLTTVFEIERKFLGITNEKGLEKLKLKHRLQLSKNVLTMFSISALCLTPHWNIPVRVTAYVRARPTAPGSSPVIPEKSKHAFSLPTWIHS